MAAVAASPAFIASRRRLFSALFASAGIVRTDPALAMRRPGRTGTRDENVPTSPDSATFPPDPMRWLTRATFGFTFPDFVVFNTLGATDEARWQSWMAQQLAPSAIDDSNCDAIIALANFATLNKTANQLWTDHHAITDNY
jgi:hypothetical protein